MSKQMTEIRWHGRGGQGAKTACLLLADAAFSSGKYVQGFPEYGPERMGAPITAYNRISDVPCTIHSNIYQPDYVVVVDESLLSSVDVTAGLSPEGAVLINSPKAPVPCGPCCGVIPAGCTPWMPGAFPNSTWAAIFPTPPCSPPSFRSAGCWSRISSRPIWRPASGTNSPPSPRSSRAT